MLVGSDNYSPRNPSSHPIPRRPTLTLHHREGASHLIRLKALPSFPGCCNFLYGLTFFSHLTAPPGPLHSFSSFFYCVSGPLLRHAGPIGYMLTRFLGSPLCDQQSAHYHLSSSPLSLHPFRPLFPLQSTDNFFQDLVEALHHP